ncbi:chemotaxis protein CheA [Sulfitobacter sp. SK012]|nr:chemotaxis protein CheA [Sulfitobacter sp. SK012]
MAVIMVSFFLECEELLEALQDALDSVESGTHTDETIHVMFRAVHSIKGGAGAFGLDGLVRFSHVFETALDVLRSGDGKLDIKTAKVFLHAADHLTDLVQSSRDNSDLPVAAETLVADLAALGSAATIENEGIEDPSKGLTLATDTEDRLCDFNVQDDDIAFFASFDLDQNDGIEDSLLEDPSAKIEAIVPPQPHPSQPDQHDDTTSPKTVIRVDLDRIERLINLVGELVINQAMLTESLERIGLSAHSDLMNGLDEFQRLTRDIQDSVMMIRAQPVKPLFRRMARIVRETSNALGKDVDFVTNGEATEIDKTMIERLADPLTHMIRNAVDHGLETAAQRLAQGKIRLSAAHRSGRVVIEVSDDGAGFDRDKIREVAIKKGLLTPEILLTDAEIDNLLFLPGFSTSNTVSDVSGRGVGMDVVRAAIQELGGRVATTSEIGKGTTFSISLPLTLAVMDGMIIKVADETLVLPVNSVVETLSLSASSVEKIGSGVEILRTRGGCVPLFDLGAELGYRGKTTDYEDAIVLLINHDTGARSALLIDDILDQRQVVIKGLDDSFLRAPGIAAATILGDGQIALILDPADVVTNAMGTPMVPLAVGQ